MRKVLITGGAGYIGAATAQLFLKKNFLVFVVDDLSTGKNLLKHKNYLFIKSDFSSNHILNLLKKEKIQDVIHLAASIDNNESILNPKKYYNNNFFKLIKFLENCKKAKIKNFIFSSSAAVYGVVKTFKPLAENFKLTPSSPYGISKIKGEKLIRKKKYFNSIILRYFNVAGPTFGNKFRQNFKSYKHLLKKLTEINFSRNKNIFKINGKNYNTIDGTCVRDFVHVQDIANINYHSLMSIKKILKNNYSLTLNCGSGKENSVLQIVKKFKIISKKNFKIIFIKPRIGDPPFLLSDNRLFKKKLGLKFFGINRIIKDLVK